MFTSYTVFHISMVQPLGVGSSCSLWALLGTAETTKAAQGIFLSLHRRKLNTHSHFSRLIKTDYLIKWRWRRNLLCGRAGLLHKGAERCELSAPCLYLLLLSLMNILHDIGRFCKPFFRVFMRPCEAVVGSSSAMAGTLECWQTQKAGGGFLDLLSCCTHLTYDFEGGLDLT